MIVLDASAVVELLINGPSAKSIKQALASSPPSFAAPYLLDIEVVSALRSLAARGRIESHRVDAYLRALASLPADRYTHLPLLSRIWELRHNFTAYDAAYISLAEAMGATLYTTDGKLAKGHRARVVLFGN